MKKNKLIALGAAAVLSATAVVGGTLAYFTDKDAETNTFTVGNVKIDLTEDFDQDNAKLVPTTGKDAEGNIINAIEKKVYVTNEGSEDAYVRVHIAIPQILDSGDPDFDASSNVLHFNYAKENIGEGKWDWSKTTGPEYDGDWNYYEQEIDGITYNVYVVTYEAVLEKEDKTVDAIHQVYLDSKVSNEDIAKIKEKLGDDWKILVAAEGAQAEGFADAYAALNAAFGTPGEYNPWAAE